MAKTPVAKPPVVVKQGASPFMPVVVIQQPPALLGKTNPYTGPREDGCHSYSNYDVTPIYYNGQNQTSHINQTFRP